MPAAKLLLWCRKDLSVKGWIAQRVPYSLHVQRNMIWTMGSEGEEPPVRNHHHEDTKLGAHR